MVARCYLFLTHRLNCGKANTYNVEQFERMRDGEMTVSQETNTPPAPKDGTEAQDSGKGIYPHCCHHLQIYSVRISAYFHSCKKMSTKT